MSPAVPSASGRSWWSIACISTIASRAERRTSASALRAPSGSLFQRSWAAAAPTLMLNSCCLIESWRSAGEAVALLLGGGLADLLEQGLADLGRDLEGGNLGGGLRRVQRPPTQPGEGGGQGEGRQDQEPSRRAAVEGDLLDERHQGDHGVGDAQGQSELAEITRQGEAALQQDDEGEPGQRHRQEVDLGERLVRLAGGVGHRQAERRAGADPDPEGEQNGPYWRG